MTRWQLKIVPYPHWPYISLIYFYLNCLGFTLVLMKKAILLCVSLGTSLLSALLAFLITFAISFDLTYGKPQGPFSQGVGNLLLGIFTFGIPLLVFCVSFVFLVRKIFKK